MKSNLRSLDQWMAQMELRLKPNYFRINWNRREIKQKAEEHKVRLFYYYDSLTNNIFNYLNLI